MGDRGEYLIPLCFSNDLKQLWKSLILLNCFRPHSGFMSYACVTCRHSCNDHHLIKERERQSNSNNPSSKVVIRDGLQSPNKTLQGESRGKCKKCGQLPGMRTETGWWAAKKQALSLRRKRGWIQSKTQVALEMNRSPAPPEMNAVCTQLDFILVRHTDSIQPT